MEVQSPKKMTDMADIAIITTTKVAEMKAKATTKQIIGCLYHTTTPISY